MGEFRVDGSLEFIRIYRKLTPMKTNSRIMKLVAVALLLCMSTGCKTYMQLKYGMKQPEEETPAKLYSFLQKHHFPNENMYLFSDSAAFCRMVRNSEFRKYLLSHMIFNREGILIRHDTTKCQWAGYDIIKSLNRDSVYETSNELKMSQILDKIEPMGGASARTGSFGDPDFTVVVTWAKFIGAYNYRLFILAEAADLNQKSRIRVIWLNVDMQQSWELTDQQKIAIR
jgi:hypothetical protein